MERPVSSSTDALSAGVPTMEKRTAHMENTMTIVGNDKEDVMLVTLISGLLKLQILYQLLIKQSNLC